MWLSSKESTCQAEDVGLVLWVRQNPLEKKMVTHSSILAQKIPWTEEPGGIQSTGSQKSQTQLSNYTSTQLRVYWLSRILRKVLFVLHDIYLIFHI